MSSGVDRQGQTCVDCIEKSYRSTSEIQTTTVERNPQWQNIRKYMDDEMNLTAIMSAPNDTCILSFLPRCLKGCVGIDDTLPGTASQAKASPMTLGEWGILVTIAFYEETICRKMLRSAMPLPCPGLDKSGRGNDGWADIATIFNDCSHVAPVGSCAAEAGEQNWLR
jgi:hypothetical protein